MNSQTLVLNNARDDNQCLRITESHVSDGMMGVDASGLLGCGDDIELQSLMLRVTEHIQSLKPEVYGLYYDRLIEVGRLTDANQGGLISLVFDILQRSHQGLAAEFVKVLNHLALPHQCKQLFETCLTQNELNMFYRRGVGQLRSWANENGSEELQIMMTLGITNWVPIAEKLYIQQCAPKGFSLQRYRELKSIHPAIPSARTLRVLAKSQGVEVAHPYYPARAISAEWMGSRSEYVEITLLSPIGRIYRLVREVA